MNDATAHDVETYREIGMAYVLLILAGLLGGHRFYVGQKGTAIVILILTISVVGAIVSVAWVIVDIFLLPEMVARKNNQLRGRIAPLS
ncbi:MAG: NINE protein [bacterium]